MPSLGLLPERKGLERKAHSAASSRREDLQRKARPRQFLVGDAPKLFFLFLVLLRCFEGFIFCRER